VHAGSDRARHFDWATSAAVVSRILSAVVVV
jgi:hypothetical protein